VQICAQEQCVLDGMGSTSTHRKDVCWWKNSGLGAPSDCALSAKGPKHLGAELRLPEALYDRPLGELDLTSSGRHRSVLAIEPRCQTLNRSAIGAHRCRLDLLPVFVVEDRVFAEPPCQLRVPPDADGMAAQFLTPANG
jgi:hypothetical protein